jgi:formyl-CoA transferase
VIENFRPGVMERLGLGYETLAKMNPGVIYCAISGFGLTGPYKNRPSFDIVIQALSGVLSVNGEFGRPPTKLGIPLGDLVGGIYGPIAILAALHERDKSGRGRLIDISLFDGLIGMLGYYAQLTFFQDKDPEPQGSEHPNLTPYGIYPSKDGSIVVACLTNVFWERLCRSLSMTEALADPRLTTIEGRRNNRDYVRDLVSDNTRTKTVAELEALFTEHEVPHAPVLGVRAALSHPQAVAREMVVETEHAVLGAIPIVGRSIKFPETKQAPLEAPPTLGQHTDAIMREYLGLTAEEIAALKETAVIA